MTRAESGRERRAAVPEYLSALAERAARGEVLLRRPRDERAPRTPPGGLRHAAVLLHLAGTTAAEAQLVLEERGHTLRSQPAQFSLPGGGVDPGDRDAVHTALREAEEEVGLDPADAQVLGAFGPVPMPWRGRVVTPVLSWSPQPPPLGAHDRVEVERVVWVPLGGAGSLSDPAHHGRGVLEGRQVGPVFDLPGDAFVWGFTAMLIEQVLIGVGQPPVAADAPRCAIPAARRR